DQLDRVNQETLVATGFLRLGPVRRNAGNPKVAFSRNEVLTEMTDSVGSVFLGLTIGCARCHDHKFDNFTQEEYYRIQAFLAATHEKDIVLTSKEVEEDWQKKTDRLKETIKQLKQQLADAPEEARPALEARLKQAQDSLPPPLPT